MNTSESAQRSNNRAKAANGQQVKKAPRPQPVDSEKPRIEYHNNQTEEGTIMSFADNLIYLRQHYGVTQEGLAEQLGVSRQTVSKWESGANNPEMDKLLQLCDLFHTNMDDLMRGSVQVAKEDDTARYDQHMNRYSLSITLGVPLILLGVGASGALEAFAFSNNFAAAVLLSFMVVGIVIMVMGGLNHGEFKRRNPSIEPRYSVEALDRFGRRFSIMIGSGVGLILLGVILLIGLTPDSDQTHVGSTFAEDIAIAPFMFILAIAVGLLIWAGMQKSKYTLSELTYIAHRQDLGSDLPLTVSIKTPEQVRIDRILGVLCGIIMLLATIVFLVWGFVPLFDQIGSWDGVDKDALKDAIKDGQGGFAVSWISFAVGGLLCGIVCLAGSVFSKSKDDWIAEARQEDAWLKVANESVAQDDPWARGNQQQGSTPPPPAPGTEQTRKTASPSNTVHPDASARTTWK